MVRISSKWILENRWEQAEVTRMVLENRCEQAVVTRMVSISSLAYIMVILKQFNRLEGAKQDL
jgi:hypothetical protein